MGIFYPLLKIDTPQESTYTGFMKFNILIVDDELELCLSLSEILEGHGYNAYFCTNGLRATELIKKKHIHLALIDIKMPSINGLELLRQIKQENEELPVIIISGYAGVNDAIKAMKYGALNLYVKPLRSAVLLEEIQQLEKGLSKRQQQMSKDMFLSKSPAMIDFYKNIEKVSRTHAAILLTGESGTGKERYTRMIHRMSPRSCSNLVVVNCAALPEPLLESLMFGHEKGAFTDAKETKEGLFERAHNGTIFLDEIGDMSLSTQAKMLRVLEEQRFTRVGGTTLIETNARVIAATNVNLPEAIEEKKFRSDLYYRLSVVSLHIPSLKNRREDIIPMAYYFLDYFNAMYETKICRMSERVENLLYNHSWPGNVRELKNLIERLAIFCSKPIIEMEDLPDQYKYHSYAVQEIDLVQKYDKMTHDIIIEALNRANGVKQKAAELLGIDRKTLNNKMKKYKITYGR